MMRIKFNQIRESFKEIKLDKILDKISRNEVLNNSESIFLRNYEEEIDHKDYKLLSKENVIQRLQNILKNKKVICNLYDSDGKIGLPILEITNKFQGECYLQLKNNEKIPLMDNFLYNILYISKKDQYSLESEDEFFEKIEIKNED